MRRSLPLAVAVVALSGIPIPAAASPSSSPDSAPADPALSAVLTDASIAAGQPVEGVDIAAAVPALQETFADRYGGYWIEGEGDAAVTHVGVVGATESDRATVARLTGGHARVVTEPVANGYDALVAASEEITETLDPASGDFSVGVDPAANAVVVQTETTATDTIETSARAAAERGVAADDEVPEAAAETIDSAVVVEPGLDIAIRPAGVHRNEFPRYEPGLNVTVHAFGGLVGCTGGLLFRNSYGLFGSTAGHCGPINSGVVIGPHIVDWIRLNSYFSTGTVLGDAALYSMSARRWDAWPVVHTQGGGHRPLKGKLSNAQIATGLSLCFEGRTSDGNNCGTVVRANQSFCCDATGRTYVYSCTDYTGRPGDSGGPVYQRVGALDARAAGMLSSTVTINGSQLMCFSTVANLERATRSTVQIVR